jgi:hypothetical protein
VHATALHDTKYFDCLPKHEAVDELAATLAHADQVVVSITTKCAQEEQAVYGQYNKEIAQLEQRILSLKRERENVVLTMHARHVSGP